MLGSVEGIAPGDPRGAFGGDDDTHDCGTIDTSRIEYAGFRFGADNELNGLTVGGCGDQTVLSYIQSPPRSRRRRRVLWWNRCQSQSSHRTGPATMVSTGTRASEAP